MAKLRLAAVACVCAASLAIAPATRAAWAGQDPSSNLKVNPSCAAGVACLSQAVGYLNQGRARLGRPAYQLPSNFAALNPAEQMFVLTNLDRVAYGLRPITGLTADLDQIAATGARYDRDPVSNASSILSLTSNWAGGYANAALAYEAWMYDDGPGSNNVDCLTAGASGCWGHRHDILWRFGSGPLAMGAAAGNDGAGIPCYAMLIVQGSSGYHPAYEYTWGQAVAAGAGPTTYVPRAVVARVRHRRRRHHRRRRRH